MQAINEMLRMTSQGINWALARFNDGEMMAMREAKGAVARGDQKCTKRLQDELQMCIGQWADRLFIGLPCGVCYPKLRKVADMAVNVPPEMRTLAVVQTNRNLIQFKCDMPKALKNRRVVWVSGGDQDVTKLPFDVAYHVKVKTKDAHCHNWTDMINHTFEVDDVVFLSCGPLATVLAVRLFLDQPYATFIDIGSTWDPETRGVSHSCHNYTLKACVECN